MALQTHLFLRAKPLSRSFTPCICLTAIPQKDGVSPRAARLARTSGSKTLAYRLQLARPDKFIQSPTVAADHAPQEHAGSRNRSRSCNGSLTSFARHTRRGRS